MSSHVFEEKYEKYLPDTSLLSRTMNPKFNIYSNFICTVFTLNFFVLGFNDTSTLVGHFVSSPREREKRY